MSTRADREPHDELPVDKLPEKDSRELVLRAREGDRSSAYDVLGQQHPVEVWVGVLQALAKDPGEVDLELVAHRALRRPAPVVLALVQLARAAGTPVAAFLARVIAESRDEEQLRSEASALNEELVKSLDVREQLAAGDELDALYAMLARPLRDEAEIVTQIESDAGATAALFGAARSEYERLQEVARDTRWRSGSYRHALRHAIADLALVAGAGGRLEDQAYRLLQLRTEEPEANAELLELVSSELRSRYLEWALERSAAESSPARALFALAELERYPQEMPEAAVAGKYVDPRAHALRARYLETFGGDEVPVPVESIAEDLLGLRVEERWDLGDTSGLLLPAERLIVLNAAERSTGRNDPPLRRYRFTIAHELGHWICHAHESINAAPTYCRQNDLARDADRALEREANVFAAELLMPEPLVRAAWSREADPVYCAAGFDVSPTAMQWRLYSFGLVEGPPE